MSTDDTRASLLRYADAFNRRDLETIARCFADDVVSNVSEELGLGQGREAFLEYVRLTFEGVPDARIELLDVVAEGDVVAVRYRGTGTHEGELLGIPPSGNTIALEVAAFARFNARGEIAEYHSYADNLTLMQQLGALPEDAAG